MKYFLYIYMCNSFISSNYIIINWKYCVKYTVGNCFASAPYCIVYDHDVTIPVSQVYIIPPKASWTSVLWNIDSWTKSVNSLQWGPRALPGQFAIPLSSLLRYLLSTVHMVCPFIFVFRCWIMALHFYNCTLMLSHTQTYRPKIITPVGSWTVVRNFSFLQAWGVWFSGVFSPADHSFHSPAICEFPATQSCVR